MLQPLSSCNIPEGITVEHVLRLIDENAEQAMCTWNYHVRRFLLAYLPNIHWKDDIWNIIGRPTLSLVLHNNDLGADHWLQTHNMDPRIVRQGQWMPNDVMKPPKARTPDTNELLPGIYGIGFHAPVFEDR
jgi:hypothetical protein